jgi:uncharacterized protein (TIGR02452 family)
MSMIKDGVKEAANYFLKRDENREHAIKVVAYFDAMYHDETKKCIKDSYIMNPDITAEVNAGTDVMFEMKKAGTYEALVELSKKYRKKKFTVLNFASYKHPGGMFMNGSSAQEESLCHKSNLYSVLSAPKFYNEYYVPHNEKGKTFRSLYTNELIYSPDVIFKDIDNDSKPIFANVITCAAPNAGAYLKYKGSDPNTCEYVMYNRIDALLMSEYFWCKEHDEKRILILGAFGTGVFKNPVRSTAAAFMELLMDKYRGCFDTIVFAIPDEYSYNIFQEELDIAMLGPFKGFGAK